MWMEWEYLYGRGENAHGFEREFWDHSIGTWHPRSTLLAGGPSRTGAAGATIGLISFPIGRFSIPARTGTTIRRIWKKNDCEVSMDISELRLAETSEDVASLWRGPHRDPHGHRLLAPVLGEPNTNRGVACRKRRHDFIQLNHPLNLQPLSVQLTAEYLTAGQPESAGAGRLQSPTHQAIAPFVHPQPLLGIERTEASSYRVIMRLVRTPIWSHSTAVSHNAAKVSMCISLTGVNRSKR